MTMGWSEKVAKRARVTVEEIEDVLSKYSISPDLSSKSVHNMYISRLLFSGEKSGSIVGNFKFEWDGLGPGVWSVASDGTNLVGKSTVLEIILWCLRGEPKGLQDDVRRWLDHVELDFVIDSDLYHLNFDVNEGVPIGALSIHDKSVIKPIDNFSSDGGFSAAMSRFMMGKFDLSLIPTRFKPSSGKEKTVLHGWTALSGALYIGGDHAYLLGDVQMGGLPARLLQLYVGLPWAHTLMQAKTILKQLEYEEIQRVSKVTSRDASLAELKKNLEVDMKVAQKALEKLGDGKGDLKKIKDLNDQLSSLSKEIIKDERASEQTDVSILSMQAASDEDERQLRNLKENAVAQEFFNGIAPSCCPRCEKAVAKEKVVNEVKTMECSVCTETISLKDSESVNEAQIVISERQAKTFDAITDLKNQRASANKELVQKKLKQTDLTKEILALNSSDAFEVRRKAELDLARVEGALARILPKPLGEEKLINPDLNICKAILKEAQAAYDEHRKDLMKSLDVEILEIAKRIGIVSLEEVQISSNASMSLKKGGESSSFSRLTLGERLRLRIATAIALLRVGKHTGAGRHPGMIIIDSAEEANETDLAILLSELKKINDEMDYLQIFFASDNAQVVMSTLPKENCKIAHPGSYLW